MIDEFTISIHASLTESEVITPMQAYLHKLTSCKGDMEKDIAQMSEHKVSSDSRNDGAMHDDKVDHSGAMQGAK